MAMGPIRSRGHGRRRAPMADINVTPFVDVMLVLLIIFMVTAPLMTAGVEVNLPDSRAGAVDQAEAPVLVAIDGSGRTFIGEEEVPVALLPTRFEALARAPKPPQIFLHADRGLDYGQVMRVMGELNRAGLNRVALVTVGQDEQ
ncbi:MAG: protein TolR [Sphingomonas sp. SCN 67-18]|uniref:ExbD/TolR family protein n=1 Tax=uncultured Sphingomonas sp. TaxID=158754 RepID=UPI00086A2DAA|nr:biopolymer transporter ExbD [Sphingomonas sp. SCN 67-18]ODU22234.1 MAG: protein TolR [Sphingomonas sp. SCN 67-18]